MQDNKNIITSKLLSDTCNIKTYHTLYLVMKASMYQEEFN